MKNREKYIDEIITTAVNGTCCGFMLDKVMPNLIDSSVNANNLCEDGRCTECSMLFALWLDEEYTEPPKPEVDWDNVPVDTLVRVRDNDNEEWVLQYFKGIDKNRENIKYMAWSYGATSATAQGNSVHWQYCELVEDEDDEEYEEPPKPEVDWNKVPVDTLVRVRNRESEDWRLMYFKELRTDYVFKRHITWKDGKTSKTAEGDCVGWQYCELVEDEDDEE